MPKLNPNLFLDDDFEQYGDRQQHRLRKHKPNYQPKQAAEQVVADIAGPDVREDFEFSYRGSKHEREWILNSLGNFYDEHWLDDVVSLLKGGKEANVYRCLGNSTTQVEYIAAKVYRPRQFRNLRNDHLYREGRTDLDDSGNQITNDGKLQAMRSRSSYGQRLLHTSWIEYEYQALSRLHAAGGDVPRPYARGHNAILMEYIGGPNQPAPTLNSIRLEAHAARRSFEQVIHNINLMLSEGQVHGDLSAFNILYWDRQIVLIDFPQVVSPRENRNAYRIFERDVSRVCEYFARNGLSYDPYRMAAQLWEAHGHRMAENIHPGLLDADDDRDRVYWQRLQEK